MLKNLIFKIEPHLMLYWQAGLKKLETCSLIFFYSLKAVKLGTYCTQGGGGHKLQLDDVWGGGIQKSIWVDIRGEESKMAKNWRRRLWMSPYLTISSKVVVTRGNIK